jgi:hypothetical protein
MTYMGDTKWYPIQVITTNPKKESNMTAATNPEMKPEKRGRGRPKKANKLTVLQRVRRHRYRQEIKNEQHMRELIAIIKQM